MESLLQISNIKKMYYSSGVITKALNDISLEVRKKDFLAIMGPSGCGKSTLLNIMGLLDNPNEGDIIFLGQQLSKLNEKNKTILRKNHIGFIFQNFNLIDELTIFENIELPLIYLKINRLERKKTVYNLMDKFKISHKANFFPKQLSGGQQQKVAIARALASKPQILLADEPTGNLDSKNREDIMQLLWELNQEDLSIVMVTHSLADADYASHIIHLLDGQIVGKQSN